MKRISVLLSVAALVGIIGLLVYADGVNRFREFLIGYEEVPSISTPANGEFRARINNNATAITYQLSYRELEADVTQAHIHFARKRVNGGITVFLCTNLGNGPEGTQACPPAPATITGTITAADVSPDVPATEQARMQGMETGEFDEFLDALRADALYVNVHSTKFPAGEMRAQLDAKGCEDKDHDDDKHDGDQK